MPSPPVASRLTITSLFFSDATLQADIIEWRKPFEEFSKVVVGQTATALDQTSCQREECTLGDAVTDSMVYARTSIGAQVDFA